MAYSDLEMRAFTQIAYMDFGKGDSRYNALKLKYGDKVPLKELLSSKQAQDLRNMGITDDQINSWNIVNIHNTNTDNGFYGCMIETSPGNATIAFRGSEGLEQVLTAKTDWSDADLALLNSVLTKQEAEAKKYLESLKENGIWDQYDSVALTGHSLGGELAEYAAIISVRLGMDDKITQCVSMDGPGHSSEFLEEYKEEIKKIAPKMDHPRWSAVGNLLFDLPGVHYRNAKVSNDANWKKHAKYGQEQYTEDEKKDYNSLTRHDTKYLCFDEDGNLIPGEKDWLSSLMRYISQGVDYLPSIIGNTLNSLLRGMLIGIAWLTEHDLLKAFGVTAALILAPIAIAFPLPTLTAIVFIISLAVIIPAIGYIYHFTVEAIKFICDSIMEFAVNVYEKIAAAYKWTKEKLQTIKTAIKTKVKKIKAWFEKTFGNNGAQIRTNEIRINTYSLHMYSGKLRDINRRITYVDSRLDSLYGRVGLLDLFKLLQADLLVGYSWKLLRCSEYLDVTANEFERTEAKLVES